MRNGNRLLSLLMVVLGSVPSTMAVKRAKGPSTRRPSSTQTSKRTGRTAGSKRVGKPRNGAGSRKSSVTTLVLNDQGKKKVMKKKGEKDKIAVAVGVPVSVGLVGSGAATAAYQYYYSDGQIFKRNFEKSDKFKSLSVVTEAAFDLLPAYEMKCDTSGEGNLKTRSFVWLKKGDDEWYVLMRKDNKTVKGALKGLGDLFEKKQVSMGSTTSSGPEYDAKVSMKDIDMDIVSSTANKMGKMSTGNIVKLKTKKGGKISKRIMYELGGPEEKKKKAQINLEDSDN